MAIKVNGTTVIDDSRNISNIAGGFKTINSTSILGSGDISAGSSTTYDAVGTYVFGYRASTITQNSTYAGSSIQPAGYGTDAQSNDAVKTPNAAKGGSSLSGTWRAMGRMQNYYPASTTLFVRIS